VVFNNEFLGRLFQEMIDALWGIDVGEIDAGVQYLSISRCFQNLQEIRHLDESAHS
jgi:hypothetical protein